MNSKRMSQGEFEQLRSIIQARSGIDLDDNKKSILDSRLMRRLSELGLDGFDQYITLLSTGPFQMDEFQEMLSRILINETSFFRNQTQLDVFEKKILPVLLERRSGARRLRIWSNACATGEEPYTIAIMLHRTLGPRLSDWTIEILGTDISESALKTAREGRYPEYAFRTTPAPVRDRYFKPDGALWRLDSRVRAMVRFEALDLKDRMGARRHGTWDVIFCRNVLSSFDEDLQAGLSDTFAGVVADDGYVLVGHSEKLTPTPGAFVPLASEQAFGYRAPDAPDPTAAETETDAGPATAPKPVRAA